MVLPIVVIDLLDRLGVVGSQREMLLELLSRYNEGHRSYHLWTHILEMLEEFKKIRELLKDPDAVAWAILFHDIVYYPHNPRNEEDSAEVARMFLTAIGMDAVRINDIYGMIMATKHDLDLASNNDTAFLLDLDLLIFASDWEAVLSWEKGIRNEYAFVPPDLYRAKRETFLRRFVEKEVIYHTEHFRSRYQNSAKANLERLIDKVLHQKANRKGNPMGSRVGVVLLSGDPITKGHIALIEMALVSEVVDTIVVGIAHNPAKPTGLFPVEERVALAQQCLRLYDWAECVSVELCGGSAIDFAYHHGAHVIIRGLRNGSDTEYELEMANANGVISEQRFGKRITTIYFGVTRETFGISSTLARGYAQAGMSAEELSMFVLKPVADALEAKFAR